MPSRSRPVPSYRRHKPTGQAVVTLNGCDKYLGKYGTVASRKLYDRLIAEWLLLDRKAAPVADDVLTVTSLCGRYLRHAEDWYQKDGECTGVVPAIKCVMRYLRDWYGTTPAVDFGPLALKAVRERMVGDGLSRRYVNDHTARIKRIWKWGVGEQLVPAATYQALAVVPGLQRGRSDARETNPIEPVADTTVDATLPHLPDVVADMVRTQRLTGMRPAEVCILRPCDLDRSGDVWSYKPTRHKTEHHGRKRVVFIGPKAQAVLLRYLARDSKTFCFRPCDSETKRRAAQHEARVTPVNCGNVPGSNRRRKPKRQAGEVYTTDSYRRAIARACDKAFPHESSAILSAAELAEWQKAKRWAPNQLRHTAGTEIRRTFGLEAAQVILGHSKADTTQIYAERDAEKGREVALKIG